MPTPLDFMIFDWCGSANRPSNSYLVNRRTQDLLVNLGRDNRPKDFFTELGLFRMPSEENKVSSPTWVALRRGTDINPLFSELRKGLFA